MMRAKLNMATQVPDLLALAKYVYTWKQRERLLMLGLCGLCSVCLHSTLEEQENHISYEQVLWNKVNWLISTINLSPWAFSSAAQGGSGGVRASGEVASEVESHPLPCADANFMHLSACMSKAQYAEHCASHRDLLDSNLERLVCH